MDVMGENKEWIYWINKLLIVSMEFMLIIIFYSFNYNSKWSVFKQKLNLSNVTVRNGTSQVSISLRESGRSL